MSLIELKHVSKVYPTGGEPVRAVDDISLQIEKGEFCVVVGSSGAGKTTLLNILGGMDRCTEGEICVDGKNIAAYSPRKLTAFRRHEVGFVFQFYNLIGNLTALENVELAAQICKNPKDAAEVLKSVGLAERMKNFPAQLSGGEQQRVAIARAVAKNPTLLLCDEPTGALDYKTGKAILKLLHTICKEQGVCVIVITHNQAIKPMADRVITIKSGKLESEVRNSAPSPIEELEW